MRIGAQDRFRIGDAAAPVAVIDRDIDPLCGQPFLDLAAIAFQHAKPDARIIVAQLCGQFRDERARGNRDQPQRHFAGRPVRRISGGFLERSGVRQQRAALRQHPLADLGQRDAAAGAVKQPAADLALQRRDLPAQRRLRNAERIGRANIAAVRRHLDKRLEMPELHGFLICRFGNSELSSVILQHGWRRG